MTDTTPYLLGPGSPSHVAIIMDGNGRWAEDRGLSRLEGHRKGAQVVRDITVYARELGLSYLTLYSFSRQNWRRAPFEVAGLMALLEDYCRQEERTLMDNGIRLTTIGDNSRLPRSTRRAVDGVAERTRNNIEMTMCLALDYGGREEILAATKRLVQDVVTGQRSLSSLDEEAFSASLDTAHMPDPDLLLRTGGELRVSNFLLWQLSYTELHFTPVRWPDFTRHDFLAALKDFSTRQRRFGLELPQAPPSRVQQKSCGQNTSVRNC